MKQNTNIEGNNNIFIQDINGSTINIQQLIPYPEKAIYKFLGAFPVVPETFLGRETELQHIHQQLFAGENLLLLVNGEGGMGKTTLAAKYYFQYENQYQHLAWVFAERSLLDALLMLAVSLEMSFDAQLTNTQRLPLLLNRMRNLSKPCLLVVDNANHLADLEKHYAALRTCPNFHILLTTRITEFAQAKTYKIEGLPEKEALTLFRQHYPTHNPAEDALFLQIRHAVGGNTLVIELLAKTLHIRNEYETEYHLTDLVSDIQQGLSNLRHTEKVMIDWHEKGIVDAKEIIMTIYDLSELTPEEAPLLAVFAVLPAEAIAFETLKTLLPNLQELKTTLRSLAKKGWLDYNALNKSFKTSPVIQEISRKKHTNLCQDCQSLVDSLIDKLKYEPGTGHLLNATYSEAVLYAHYSESIINHLSLADNAIAILCERMGAYHTTTGNLTQAFSYNEKYLHIRKALCEAYPDNSAFKNGLAICYEKLGNTHSALGNLDKALTFYEELLRLEKELYETYPLDVSFKNGLAISFQYLGITHSALGNLDKALTFYEEDLQLTKELYEAYPSNVNFKNDLAISYSKLGNTHSALGNLDKALTFYKELNRLEKELYEAYPSNISFKNGLAVSYCKLGETHSALGNLDKALTFYEEHNCLEKELYEAYPSNVSFKNGLAISYYKLGELYRDKKPNKVKAINYFQAAEQHWVALVAISPQYAEFRKFLGIVQRVLESLENG